MSDRPATKETLAKWLLDNGHAEAKRGYGHVSADDLAEALLDTYRMYERAEGTGGASEV